jgi:hypothetical protein
MLGTKPSGRQIKKLHHPSHFDLSGATFFKSLTIDRARHAFNGVTDPADCPTQGENIFQRDSLVQAASPIC